MHSTLIKETNQEDILFQIKNDYIKLEIMVNGKKIILLDHKVRQQKFVKYLIFEKSLTLLIIIK